MAEDAARKAVARNGAASTVLVVEDDEVMQFLVVTQLDSLGYRTIACTDAAAALAAAEEARTGVDVLLTDLVLPGGINGRQLADTGSRRSFRCCGSCFRPGIQRRWPRAAGFCPATGWCCQSRIAPQTLRAECWRRSEARHMGRCRSRCG